MLLSPRKNGLDSLFKEVRVFKKRESDAYQAGLVTYLIRIQTRTPCHGTPHMIILKDSQMELSVNFRGLLVLLGSSGAVLGNLRIALQICSQSRFWEVARELQGSLEGHSRVPKS